MEIMITAKVYKSLMYISSFNLWNIRISRDNFAPLLQRRKLSLEEFKSKNEQCEHFNLICETSTWLIHCKIFTVKDIIRLFWKSFDINIKDLLIFT